MIVGSLPTTDSQLDTAGAGCLLVLDSTGKVVKTIAGGQINGPWDMTAVDHGFFATLYVTNVENGDVATSATPVDKGTVVRIQLLTIPRIRPVVLDEDVIATGFPELASSTAVVLGPTGVALSRFGTLYVADAEGNRIAAIPDANDREFPIGGGGITVTSGGALNAPLGMTLAPNGDILTANGDDGFVVETTPGGQQVSNVDTGFGAGSLFGLTVPPGANSVYLDIAIVPIPACLRRSALLDPPRTERARESLLGRASYPACRRASRKRSTSACHLLRGSRRASARERDAPN